MTQANNPEAINPIAVEIPEGEYRFPETEKAIDDEINKQNAELLEKDPNEYLIGLLNDLGDGLDNDEQEIANNIIHETFGNNFSMKDLFDMDITKKTELLWKLTAIIKYIPRNPNDVLYTSITDGLRKGEIFGKLKMKLGKGILKKPTVDDLKDYFKKAQDFQYENMYNLFKKTFPIGTKYPDMPYYSLTGDALGNSSISEDFSNVGREYFKYNLSE